LNPIEQIADLENMMRFVSQPQQLQQAQQQRLMLSR
jgi:hypothetical protein